jgi:hypothetical protein
MALKLVDRKYEVFVFAFVVVLLIGGPLYIARQMGRFGKAEELTLVLVE